jgi:hypothetical protein
MVRLAAGLCEVRELDGDKLPLIVPDWRHHGTSYPAQLVRPGNFRDSAALEVGLSRRSSNGNS